MCQGYSIYVLGVQYLCVRGIVFVCQWYSICVLGVRYLCVGGIVSVCQGYIIYVLRVYHLCVRGIVSVCQGYSICVLEVSIFSLSTVLLLNFRTHLIVLLTLTDNSKNNKAEDFENLFSNKTAKCSKILIFDKKYGIYLLQRF